MDDPRKRFITTSFCYGCNLCPVQTARSVKGLSRKQVAWLNLKHVTEQRLDKATYSVRPPRRPNPASYSAQFVTLNFIF